MESCDVCGRFLGDLWKEVSVGLEVYGSFYGEMG